MRVGSAAWWAQQRREAERRRRPRAAGLSLDRILDAALDIVDGEGLEALTMRRLADDLGATHSALYRHVGGHQQIVVLLVDRLLGEVATDELPGEGPRARAERLLRRYRAVLLAHPHLAPAFLHGQLLGPNALARREEGLRMLLDAGAPPDLAVRAYLTLTHFAITSAVFEASGAARSAEERAAMERFFRELPAAEYPTLNRLASELNAPDGEAEFALGLTALLDHVEAAVLGAPGDGRRPAGRPDRPLPRSAPRPA